MEPDPNGRHASNGAKEANQTGARPALGVWVFLKACFGFLFWGEWNRFGFDSESVSETRLDLLPAALQVLGGVVVGVLPFLMVGPWVDANPFWLGYGSESVFFGSVIATVIGFGLALTFHGIAIPFLLHFKRPFVAVGIGLFYGIGAVVFLAKMVQS